MLAMILMLLAVNTAIAGNVALEAQRKLFQAAEKLSATGKPLPRQMKTLLRNYPLYPYLEYA
ncbi:hypothetical protein, partial [Thiolapillus sp.]|uniref:hypothetical protein n=1 Tax=Thiolapillus sp. TaxID=2017437 RepID=UPI003AF6DF58